VVVANTSLLIAVLVYMGWAYYNAFFAYFHVDVLYLGIGVIEYMLVSLNLFSTKLVIAATVLILLTVPRTWNLDPRKLARRLDRRLEPETDQAQRIPVGDPSRTLPHSRADGRKSAVTSFWRLASLSSAQVRTGRPLPVVAGAIATVTGIALALLASYYQINTYLVLGLLACGPLLLAWPTRTDHRGRLPYSLAIIVAAVCALWVASLYASNLGRESAQQFALDLPTRTSVILYTTQPLALSGPGVTIQQLPPGSFYHFRYEGLRLLTMRSGTYYLLPVGWSPKQGDSTYTIDESDQIRIELY
jgi:hypothetical protein